MARVTGIGGIFLRARDPKSLSAWYAAHLGIHLDDYGGATLLWTDEVPATTGMTIWNLFPEDSPYFGKGNEKGQQQAMVNYRVDDLDALLTQLAAGFEGCRACVSSPRRRRRSDRAHQPAGSSVCIRIRQSPVRANQQSL